MSAFVPTLTLIATMASLIQLPGTLGNISEKMMRARDGGIPPISMVALDDKPTQAFAFPPGARPEPGLSVRVFTHQASRALRPIVTLPWTSGELSFAAHNNRLRELAGKNAEISEWVFYVANGLFTAKEPGQHTFSLMINSPEARMGCFALIVIGGEEIFPDHQRKILKKIPPLILVEQAQKRTFQRDVALDAGAYEIELTAACFPGAAPKTTVDAQHFKAWQSMGLQLQVRAPKEGRPRSFTRDELVALSKSEEKK